MATIRQIKEKQTSIISINKITKAMQLVSTAKAQKAIRALRNYESYYLKVESIVNQIVIGTKQKSDFKGIYWIAIMSDLGLAGGYNAKIIKLLLSNISAKDEVLVIGLKGKNLEEKLPKNKVTVISVNQVENTSNLSWIQTTIQSAYRDNDLKIKVIYTKFISQIEFEPLIKTLLPIKIDQEDLEKIPVKKTLVLTEFEPDKETLLREIEDTYIQALMIGLHREAQASEQTSRRIAMENATTNGNDLLKELNVAYNRTRQAKITQELSEIIGGAEALK
ncbi:MAG: ATP synthase F1 subunit gamma [Mycoplasmataceae bacterium]|nr:ATP synthase F1 subunit gamma [Mycoplasmataceae bacterium]